MSVVVASVVSGFFFKKMIEQNVKRFGTNHFISNLEDIAAIRPNLIILDLEHPEALKVLREYGSRTIAYGLHTQHELHAIARNFGAKAYTRSALFFDMNNILHQNT